MKEIFFKSLSEENLISQLKAIGFDKDYLPIAQDKYRFRLYKIFNLRCPEANILKQIALSVGCDCAVNRNVITSEVEISDCILGCTLSQLREIVTKLKKQPFGLKLLAKKLETQFKLVPEGFEIRGKLFDFAQKKYIMGILNCTPDSFSDGGKYTDEKSALKRTEQMLSDGADIIDIGAESTRPNSNKVTVEEEQKRLMPILKAVRKNFPNCVISVDTRNSDTAIAACNEGADIINDISGFEHDKNMLKTVVKLGLPYVLTDFRKNGETECIVDTVFENLYNKVKILEEEGFERKKIILDVGIGFGKTVDENFELASGMKEFSSMGLPILLGHSRKSFLGKTLNMPPENLDCATAALSFHFFLVGANILRVHDVKTTAQMLTLAEKF